MGQAGLDRRPHVIDCLLKLMATETRNRILSVAARLFEAEGFEGTAVASILREADVNSGSLYHFFPGKEALLVAVLEKYLETLDGGLLQAADRATEDPLEKVFALLELYRGRLLVSDFSRGCPVGDLSLEVGGRFPEARRLVEAYFAVWTTRVAEWLDSAGARLSEAVDRRALAVHVLSVLQGATMQARASTSIDPFDDSVGQLRLLLQYLATGEASIGAGRRARGHPTSRSAAGGAESSPGGAAVLLSTRGDTEVPERSGEGVAADEAAWWRAW